MRVYLLEIILVLSVPEVLARLFHALSSPKAHAVISFFSISEVTDPSAGKEGIHYDSRDKPAPQEKTATEVGFARPVIAVCIRFIGSPTRSRRAEFLRLLLLIKTPSVR